MGVDQKLSSKGVIAEWITSLFESVWIAIAIASIAIALQSHQKTRATTIRQFDSRQLDSRHFDSRQLDSTARQFDSEVEPTIRQLAKIF